MTQGVPGEDEMTSRAGQALLDDPRLRRADIGRDALGEAVAAIEQEVRDDIRDAVMRLTEHPDCICGGEENRSPTVSRREVLAAISSSSATETDGMTHRELLAYKAGELAGRQAERLGVSATETQDGERLVLDPNQDFDAVGDDFLGLKWRPDRASIEEIAAGIEEIGTGGTPAFVRGYNRGYDDAYEHAATPTPDDRDRIYPCGDPDCEQPKPHTIGPNWHGANTWTIAVPDDRDREVERIAAALHDTTPVEQDGGVPDVCNRYDEHEALATALYDAGLRASGGKK